MRAIAVAVSLLAVFICHARTIPKDTADHTKNVQVKDTIQQVLLDTMSVTAPAGLPDYQPSAPRVWDIRNTRVALSFDFMQKTADIKEWITLKPYFYAVDSLVLDAKGMRIDSVLLVSGKGKSSLTFTHSNDQLRIRFGRQYRNTETVELYLRYTAMPYGKPTGGSGAIRDDRGLYFINTDHSVPHKPVQIWTQGETESNSHWMVTMDKPNVKFTTQIELTVPDSLITLSNGAMIRSVKGSTGLRTDIWKMDQPISAYSVMFAIGKFAVIKESWRNKEVSYYVEPNYGLSAYLMFNHTRDMLEYFSQKTGVAYPWNKYSQVVVRDYVSGAMENTSATLFGEFMNQNAREYADRNSEDVVSHELFHQWFGDYVTCESWSNITVNESFANYGEQLWRGFKFGRASRDELAYNDLLGYVRSSNFSDPPLVRFQYDSREEVFDAVSYSKGGAILRYLNRLAGDEAFDRAMNIYLTRNALRNAEAHTWRLAVEEATGQDWNWFFNQWYYRGGHPVLKVGYNYNDTLQKLIVTFSQAQSDSSFIYRLPLKAAVIYGSNRTVMDWTVDKIKDSLVLPYKNGQRPVFVPDYERVLPGEIRDGKKMPEWKVQYKNADNDDYINKRLAVAAAARLLSDTNSQSILDLALADYLHPIRLYALTQLKNTTNEKYRQRWEDYVVSMVRYDSDKLVRQEAFNVLGDWKVTSAKNLMAQSVNYSSYAISGSALEALSKIDPDTAYIIAKEVVKKDPKTTLEVAAWTIICKKANDEDIELLEQHVPWVFGNKRFYFASGMSNYMKNVKSDESFRRCAAVYVTMIATEGMRAYRSMFGGYLFQVAADVKSSIKSEKPDEAAAARRRYDLLRPIMQRMTEKEKDDATAEEFKGKMKEIFE